MKVGILTFHWGTNYGGVLQAYALQSYLKRKGYDVDIINYAPHTHRESVFLCMKSRSVKSISKKLYEYRKERKFVFFRNKFLSLTTRCYTLADVEKQIDNYNVVICGSDQIWNPYIIDSFGIPYFLPFSGEVKKVAYAASLGCNEYPQDALRVITPYLRKFTHISVRELSAVNIIKGALPDKEVSLMPDPTFLLNGDDLLSLIDEHTLVKDDNVFFYILQENQSLINKIKLFYKASKASVFDAHGKFSAMSIEEWLSGIKYSNLVVTNSFHGVVFSILLHKKFIVVPIEGHLGGMNDRIYTLLQQFDLQERIIEQYNEEDILKISKRSIDWDNVDKVSRSLYSTGESFLLKALS